MSTCSQCSQRFAAQQTERAEVTAERSQWRFNDLEKKNANLQQELAQLRQQLQEERAAATERLQQPQQPVEHLSKEELMERVVATQHAYGEDVRLS